MKKLYKVKFKDLQNDDLSQCYTPFFTKREAIRKADELVEYYLGLCGDISGRHIVITGEHVDYLVDVESVMKYINSNIGNDYSVYCGDYFDVLVENIDMSSSTQGK